MINNKLQIDSYAQMLEESFSRASSSLSNCQKSLIIIRDNFEASDIDRISLNQISNDKIIEMIRSGDLSRKVEKVFWFRLFQFSPVEIELIQGKSILSSDKILRILLRVWNIKLASENLILLKRLDTILPPPDFFSKWEDLGNENTLSEISSRIGRSLLANTNFSGIPFKRGSSFSLFLISIYLLNCTEDDFLENIITNLEIDNELSNLFPSKADKVSGLSLVNFIFVAALLRSMVGRSKTYSPNLYRNLLTVRDLPSFGDPRAMPLALSWQKVQELENDGFEDWKKSFNEEDIVFFFKELNTVMPERRDFWLKYKRTADKVIVILDKPKRESLKLKFVSDEKALDIVNRSFCYNSDSKQEQYLVILFFKQFVVIEGSNTGFGCQIFAAEEFNKKFGKSFLKNNDNIINERRYDVFRGSASGRKDSWTHHGSGWEDEFKINLIKFGIFQDRAIVPTAHIKKDIDNSKISTVLSSITLKRETEIKVDDFKDSSSIKKLSVHTKPFEKNKLDRVSEKVEIKTIPSPSPIIEVNIEFIKKTLKTNGCYFIDNTDSGGALWVLKSINSNLTLAALQKEGHQFAYVPQGGKATKFQEGWYYQPKVKSRVVDQEDPANSSIQSKVIGEILKNKSSIVNLDSEKNDVAKIIKVLIENDVPYIDNVMKDGYLWVLSSTTTRSTLAKLRADGVNFNYTPRGSASTGNKEAWFLQIKK